MNLWTEIEKIVSGIEYSRVEYSNNQKEYIFREVANEILEEDLLPFLQRFLFREGGEFNLKVNNNFTTLTVSWSPI